VTIKQVKSDTVALGDDGPKRAKLFVTVVKHKNFDAAIKKYEKIREENLTLTNKYRDTDKETK
jgi:hypothetical protein